MGKELCHAPGSPSPARSLLTGGFPRRGTGMIAPVPHGGALASPGLPSALPGGEDGYSEGDARGAFLKGLRTAHACGIDLAGSAGAWARRAQADSLADAFRLIQEEAEEALHRVEYILSGLRRGARGGASWIGRALPPPAEDGPARAGDDAALAAAATRVLGRMAQETRWLEQLAHDLAEFQAARLLRMSADEQAAGAKRLADLVAGAGPARPGPPGP